jgi:hypothetical protein
MIIITTKSWPGCAFVRIGPPMPCEPDLHAAGCRCGSALRGPGRRGSEAFVWGTTFLYKVFFFLPIHSNTRRLFTIPPPRQCAFQSRMGARIRLGSGARRACVRRSLIGVCRLMGFFFFFFFFAFFFFQRSGCELFRRFYDSPGANQAILCLDDWRVISNAIQSCFSLH